MSTLTVSDLATELHKPVPEMLAQLKEAGVAVDNEKSPISPADKMALLSHLQKTTRGNTLGAVSHCVQIQSQRQQHALPLPEPRQSLNVCGLRRQKHSWQAVHLQADRTRHLSRHQLFAPGIAAEQLYNWQAAIRIYQFQIANDRLHRVAMRCR